MTHCEKLYNYFIEHPKATADEVMAALDWERRQVSRYKHRLKPALIIFNLPESLLHQECVTWIFTPMCAALHVIHCVVTILYPCLIKHGFSFYRLQVAFILRLLVL